MSALKSVAYSFFIMVTFLTQPLMRQPHVHRSQLSLLSKMALIEMCLYNIFLEIQPQILTYLSRMDFPTLIRRTSPFLFVGWYFYFYSNFKRNFCKQTVENLIRRHALWPLIWFCTVCLCLTKKDARLIYIYGLMAEIILYLVTIIEKKLDILWH